MISCSKNGNSEIINDEKISAPYFKILFDPDKPGCGDCHKNREEIEYTLAAKANESWEDHKFDINGELMTINDCLLCHSVDNGGHEGAIAPTPLRTIVHKAHLSSPHFTIKDADNGEVQGNCFTCHYIMGDGSPDLYNFSN